jgi:DNA-binding NarL/FixJ family response regulator
MVKVAIADYSELVRIGLRTVFSSDTEIQIVGEAISRDDLFDLLKSKSPDVIIIDYAANGFSIDVIPEVIQQFPKIRFVAITQHQSVLSITTAIKSGVSGYIKKDCGIQEIIDSVKETGNGNKFFCGTILDMIKAESINVEDISSEPLTCAPVSLSEREMEIITLIAEGYTNQEIAEKLFISAHTVNTHRKNIMGKLGINNTAGIVMYAVKSNLVSPNKYLFTTP